MYLDIIQTTFLEKKIFFGKFIPRFPRELKDFSETSGNNLPFSMVHLHLALEAVFQATDVLRRGQSSLPVFPLP